MEGVCKMSKYIYDSSSPKSIETYAKRLEKKALIDFLDNENIKVNKNNKGRLGQLIEQYYFGYALNSRKEADFEEAGVELKVSPLKKIRKRPKSDLLSKQQGWSVKERMVLTIIDYMEIHKETWDTNTLFEKAKMLLIAFYIYQKSQPAINNIFKLISLWQPSQEDLKIIKEDWKKIVSKIRDGKAHELSEGDTMYLGACTKGSSAKSVREQPFSDIPAKQRAFSFKRSYVDSIFEELLSNKKTKISLTKGKDKHIEEVLQDIFKPYLGKTAYQIEQELALNYDKTPKQYYSILANKIMGSDNEANIEEFKKANIKVKSIRLAPNDIPREHMSFPAFEFTKLEKENWDNSRFRTTLEESKFFFPIYKINTNTMKEFNAIPKEERRKHVILEKVMIWNMPMNDIENEARKVWEQTVKILKNNGPKVEIRGNRRINNFPKARDNRVTHVRPHARNRNDTNPLPNGEEFTKQSFWLNKDYLAEQING